jgi:hypothetical protein
VAWLGSTLVATSLAAQTRGPLAQPDHPGRWTPLAAVLPGRTASPLPGSAESRTMKAQLDSLVAILRRNPALAEPRGFDVIGSETVESDELPEAVPGWQPLRGMVWFAPQLWYRSCDTCAVVRADEGFGITIAVNDLRLLMVQGMGGCGGPVVFLRPREVARIGGSPLFGNGVLLIAARDVPPFLPVTRDEWIQAEINQGRNASGCHRPDYRAASWESLRSTWTPEERAAEAWDRAPGQPLDKFQVLGAPGAPRSHQWVRANPALFDSTLARATPQTMTLTVGFPRLDPRHFPRGAPRPLPCSAPLPRTTALDLDALAIHEAAMCNLDWTALRALLR